MKAAEEPSTTDGISVVLNVLNDRREGAREEAQERLLLTVYRDLLGMARRYLRHERAGHSLCPTELVHDTYLRLFDQPRVPWRNRAHFFGCVTGTMRRVLIDYARRKKAGKRIPPGARVPLDAAKENPVSSDLDMLLALDQALNRLAEINPRQARIVEMRHIAGWTEDEVAQILQISRKTVGREWRVARLWLQKRIRQGGFFSPPASSASPGLASCK